MFLYYSGIIANIFEISRIAILR